MLRFIYRQIVPKVALKVAAFSSPLLHTQTQYEFSNDTGDRKDRQDEGQVVRKRQQKPKQSQQRPLWKNPAKNANKNVEENEQLAKIIKLFRIDYQSNPNALNSIFSGYSKRISSYYRKQTREEYLALKEQLEKMAQMIPSLDYNNMELLELLNILDFLRCIGGIETFDRKIFERAKEAVFTVVSNYLNYSETQKVNEILVLYCKLAALHYHYISKLSFRLLKELEEEYNQGSQLPSFTVYQHFIVLKCLSKKSFLDSNDKKILHIFLLDLSRRQKQIDLHMLIQVVKTFTDLNLRSLFSDCQLLRVVDAFYAKAVEKVQRGIPMDLMNYLMEAQPNQNQYFKKMARIIYRSVIEKMKKDSLRFYPFSVLLGAISHLTPNEFTQQDKSIVIGRLADLFSREMKSSVQATNLQYLCQLIHRDYLSSEVHKLNQLIVSQPNFSFFWTLSAQYSIKMLPFPPQKIFGKRVQVLGFKQNVNFVKTAVTVAVQARLQPQSQELSSLFQKMCEIIQNVDWKAIRFQWLSKMAFYNPQLVRFFYQYYGRFFYDRMRPSEELIQEQFVLAAEKKKINLGFWEIFFLISEVDNLFPYKMVFDLYSQIVTLCSFHQSNKVNCQIEKRGAMLAAIVAKCRQGESKGKLNLYNILSLLQYYNASLLEVEQSFLELYFELLYLQLQSIDSLKTHDVYILSRIIMSVLSFQFMKKSVLVKKMVRKLLTVPQLFSSKTAHLAIKNACARAALHYNIEFKQYLSIVNHEFFYEEEQLMIKVLAHPFEGEIRDHQSLLLAIKNSKVSSQLLKMHEKFIEELIQSASLQQLERYLIHYSLKRGTHSDNLAAKIIQAFTSKLAVEEVDVLSVLLNIQCTFKELHPMLFGKLVQKVSQQLSRNMSVLLLVDHYQLLCLMGRNGLLQEDYAKTLLDYAYSHQKRGFVFLDIFYELSRSEKQERLDLQKITNYFLLNFGSYLKILALYEDGIQNLKDLLENARKYQIDSVSDGLYAGYLEKKYSISLKKSKDGEPTLFEADSEVLQLLDDLQNEGLNISLEEIGQDKVYLLGSKVVLAFTDTKRRNEEKLIQRALNFFYPERQLILCTVKVRLTQFQYLLSPMVPYLSESDQQLQEVIRAALSRF